MIEIQKIDEPLKRCVFQGSTFGNDFSKSLVILQGEKNFYIHTRNSMNIHIFKSNSLYEIYEKFCKMLDPKNPSGFCYGFLEK